MYLIFAYNYNILITFLYIYLYKFYNDFVNLELIQLNFYLLKLFIYIPTFINTYDKNIYLDFINNSKQNEEIIDVINYNLFDYFNDILILVIKEDYVMIIHHIITSFLLYFIKYNEFHHITLLTLLLFQLSSPYLSIAKIFKHQNKKRYAYISFGIFASIFLICRIIYFTFVVYQCIFNKYYKTYQYYYINSFILSIYYLQIYWMRKIFRIIKF